MTSILYSEEIEKIVLSILFYVKLLLHVYILSMFCYDNVLYFIFILYLRSIINTLIVL